MQEHIGVNDGHTLRGPGSGAGGKIGESIETRIVGNLVRQLLSEVGYRVSNCTVESASSSAEALSLIVKAANDKSLDWFISIHFNAGGGKGVEVYTYDGRQYQDALDVCKNIAALGFQNRGVKKGNGLYVIHKTKAKSMLIECCFVDTDDADKYLKVGALAIAKAIVEGITGIKIVEKPKFPMPLQMKYDSPAINVVGTKASVIKYFTRDQLITANSEVDEFYTVNINGIVALIPKEATKPRG